MNHIKRKNDKRQKNDRRVYALWVSETQSFNIGEYLAEFNKNYIKYYSYSDAIWAYSRVLPEYTQKNHLLAIVDLTDGGTTIQHNGDMLSKSPTKNPPPKKAESKANLVNPEKQNPTQKKHLIVTHIKRATVWPWPEIKRTRPEKEPVELQVKSSRLDNHIITVLFEGEEQSERFYLFPTLQVMDQFKSPSLQLPQGVTLVRTTSPLGASLIDAIVGQSKQFTVQDEIFRYKICSSHPYQAKIIRSDERVNSADTDASRYEGTSNQHLDAGKDLGYLARDNGRYGSLSKMDNYSEESDADGSDNEWYDR